MTPAPVLLHAALGAAAYFAALAAGFLVVTRLKRLLLWMQVYDGCRTCHLLGQIPFGPPWHNRPRGIPPYWLLRAHLRRIGRIEFADERETIQ